MSNRLIGLLIILLILVGVVGGYLYFFVFYGAKVTFNGNTPEYSVLFQTEKLKNPIEYGCESESCTIEKVAPFDYTIRISKEGYDDYILRKKIERRGEYVIDFEMLEKTALVDIEEIEASVSDVTEQKRDRLKFRSFFAYYDFGAEGTFYIREYLGKLFLYREKGESDILIYDFEKTTKDQIHINPVYNSPYFVVQVDTKNYLFNNDTTAFRGLDLGLQVSYGKEGLNDNEIILLTEKGSYIHNLDSKKSSYYYQFHDFIYEEDNTILGLIRPSDSNKRQNLNLPNNDLYYVVRYTPETKQIERVYQTIETISEMYIKGESLILRVDGKLKELTNY